MTAEDVARGAQFREGFTLVDYAEVGLPVYRLTIEAITTATRSIPTIHEFAMRCIALGEQDDASIARMLGLKDEIVRASVDALVLDGLVARTSIVADLDTFSLTPAGEERLEREAVEVVQEEMVVIDYDGIRRIPVRLAGGNVMRAAELKAFGAVEIRPYPAEAPSVTDLAISEVGRVIRRQAGGDFRRNLLALKRVVRRNNVFREAVALVYAADRGGEVQVGFAIDGKLSESHERAFAENGGPRKMGFLKMIGSSSDQRRINRQLGPDLVQTLPDPARLHTVRMEEAQARSQILSLAPAAEMAQGRRAGSPAATAMAAAQERLAAATQELDSSELRPLACFEQNELLLEAVRSARRSLTITSAGLQPSLLGSHLIRDLEQLSHARVAVRVGSFLNPQVEPRGGDHYDPLAELTKLAQRRRIELLQTPRTVLFFLVMDDDLAVVSNRPFLGEMVRRSGFQRVEGYVTRHAAAVKRIAELADGALRAKKNV